MRRILWGICLLIFMAWAASDVLAQDHNVGYYVKVAEGEDWTTFELTHSLYTLSAQNEPVRSGDILLAPPTWECPPNSQVACITSHQNIDRDRGGNYSIQSDGVKDRITVIGRRIIYQTIVLIVRGFPLSPDALTILRGTGGEVDPESDAEACTAQNIGDMDDLLTSFQQQLIADFLNSAAAENLWQNSGFEGPYVSGNRKEQAGWLYSSGTFVSAGWSSGPDECGGSIIIPPSLPPGTILVHTHPAANGEYACGVRYGNHPSANDVQALTTAGVEMGLIIDADGIIVFTEDYSSDNLDATSFKGGDDGKCGIKRF